MPLSPFYFQRSKHMKIEVNPTRWEVMIDGKFAADVCLNVTLDGEAKYFILHSDQYFHLGLPRFLSLEKAIDFLKENKK